MGRSYERRSCYSEGRVALGLALSPTYPNPHPPLFVVLVLLLLLLLGSYNVVNLGWPGVLYLDHPGFKLRDLPLPLDDWTIFPDRVE